MIRIGVPENRAPRRREHPPRPAGDRRAHRRAPRSSTASWRGTVARRFPRIRSRGNPARLPRGASDEGDHPWRDAETSPSALLPSGTLRDRSTSCRPFFPDRTGPINAAALSPHSAPPAGNSIGRSAPAAEPEQAPPVVVVDEGVAIRLQDESHVAVLPSENQHLAVVPAREVLLHQEHRDSAHDVAGQ